MHMHTHNLISHRGCGNGHFLGHGTTDHVRYPRQVLGLSNQMVTQVHPISNYSCTAINSQLAVSIAVWLLFC